MFSEPDQEVQERKIELYVGLMCAIGGVSFFTFLIQVSVVPKEESKTSDLNWENTQVEHYVGLMCAIGGVSFFTFLIQVSVGTKGKSKTSDLNWENT